MAPAAWIACLAIYLSRPWSCSFTLSTFSPDSGVPFANFDRHGFLTMVGWAIALIFAPSIMTLVARVAFANQASSRVAAQPRVSVTLGSAIIAIVAALPTFAQTAFMIHLPMAVAWPVIVTSTLWCVVIALLWIRFVRRPDADTLAQKLRPQAQIVAALILLPRLALWTWAATA